MSQRSASMLLRKHRDKTTPTLISVGTMLIEMSTPGLNQVNRMLRKSPWRYSKIKTALDQWVMVAAANERIGKATGRRHLNIIRSYRSERYRLDNDNFVGGCKALVDSCTRHQIIIDDSDKHASFAYHQIKQTDGSDWVEIGVFDYA